MPRPDKRYTKKNKQSGAGPGRSIKLLTEAGDGGAVGYERLSPDSFAKYRHHYNKRRNPSSDGVEPETATQRDGDWFFDQTPPNKRRKLAAEFEEPTTSKTTAGRPTLKPTGAMRENSLKARRRDLYYEKREEEKNVKEREELSHKRQEAAASSHTSREEHGPNTSNQDIDPPKQQPSNKTMKRNQEEFRNLIPKGKARQFEILVALVKLFPNAGLSVRSENLTTVTPRSTKYKIIKVLQEFLIEKDNKYGTFIITDEKLPLPDYNNTSTMSSTLLLCWAQELISHDHNLFASFFLTFHIPKNIPVRILAKLASEKIFKELMAEKQSTLVRNLVLTHCIRVVNEVDNWWVNKHGEVTGLAEAVGVSRKFARRVLTAVRAGKEEELFKRKARKDCLRRTDVIYDLEKFLLEERNSRSYPGQTISVGYRKRKDKYLLTASRKSLARLFLQENQQYKFSVRALLRAWPQNFVVASSRDRRRNVCPTHENFRMILVSLRSFQVGRNIMPSCRSACSLAMCQTDDVDSMEPLTWNKACAFGTCKDCPQLTLDVALGVDMERTISFTQWMKGISSRPGKDGEEKEIFSLFTVSHSITETVLLLQNMVIKLKKHIFTAYCQWEAKQLAIQNLEYGCLLVVYDYQQNVTIELSSTTTSTAFGANQVQIAEFPVVIFFRESIDGEVRKASITFFSDDLQHCHQQVQGMMKVVVRRATEITNIAFSDFKAFSDGCSAQFKSQYCVADLTKIPEILMGNPGGVAETHFFESDEGKSDSDTVGSLDKLDIERIILGNPNIVINGASELVAALKIRPGSAAESASLKLQFRLIEFFPRIQRTPNHLRVGLPLKGIRQYHQITFKNGEIKALDLSCHDCLKLGKVGECANCKAAPPIITSEKINLAFSSVSGGIVREDDDEENEGELAEYLEEEGDSGDEEEDEGSDDEEGQEEIDIGSVVWASFNRRKYPARVVSLNEVPSNIQKQLVTKNDDFVIVKFYGEENSFARYKRDTLVILGEDSLDLKWAKWNPAGYVEAVTDISYD